MTETPDRRNEFARIRTELANERTFLAYARTALMMAVTGGTLLKFFADSRELVLAGYGCMLAGAAVLVLGILRTARQRRRIGSD